MDTNLSQIDLFDVYSKWNIGLEAFKCFCRSTNFVSLKHYPDFQLSKVPEDGGDQSKAFMALIYELRNKDFFEEAECNIIDKYLPKTYLMPQKALKEIFCAKPHFELEGR